MYSSYFPAARGRKEKARFPTLNFPHFPPQKRGGGGEGRKKSCGPGRGTGLATPGKGKGGERK